MLISRKWLETFVDLGQLSANELSDSFNDLGLVVEEVRAIGSGVPGVVTAKVVSIRLTLTPTRFESLRFRQGRAIQVQVCCGVWNFNVNDIVPLATLGTVMPGGLKIERRKITWRREPRDVVLCKGARTSGRLCGFDDPCS